MASSAFDPRALLLILLLLSLVLPAGPPLLADGRIELRLRPEVGTVEWYQVSVGHDVALLTAGEPRLLVSSRMHSQLREEVTEVGDEGGCLIVVTVTHVDYRLTVDGETWQWSSRRDYYRAGAVPPYLAMAAAMNGATFIIRREASGRLRSVDGFEEIRARAEAAVDPASELADEVYDQLAVLDEASWLATFYGLGGPNLPAGLTEVGTGWTHGHHWQDPTVGPVEADTRYELLTIDAAGPLRATIGGVGAVRLVSEQPDIRLGEGAAYTISAEVDGQDGALLSVSERLELPLIIRRETGAELTLHSDRTVERLRQMD